MIVRKPNSELTLRYHISVVCRFSGIYEIWPIVPRWVTTTSPLQATAFLRFSLLRQLQSSRNASTRHSEATFEPFSTGTPHDTKFDDFNVRSEWPHRNLINTLIRLSALPTPPESPPPRSACSPASVPYRPHLLQVLVHAGGEGLRLPWSSCGSGVA